MSRLPSFADLTAEPASEPALDLLALAVAAEFRAVDGAGALRTLDRLGDELTALLTAAAGDSNRADISNGADGADGANGADGADGADGATNDPVEATLTCGRLLGDTRGFAGDARNYDDPDNSMLDAVLERRRGLPILLSVVYVEVARRAGVPVVGVGLPGHFVVGRLDCDPPVLLDPFAGGGRIDLPGAPGSAFVRAWHPYEIVWRMLNNLVAAYQRRGDLTRAIRAAEMRVQLPVQSTQRDTMDAELRRLQSRLN